MPDRRLLLETRRARASGRRGPVPLRVTLEVTGRCNSRCTHCAIWRTGRASGDDPGPELTMGELVRLAGKLLDLGVHSIDLTGGEPFLKAGIAELLSLILERRGFVCITTSALLPQRVIDAVREALTKAPDDGLLVASISIDGLEESSDAVRGIPGGFRKSVALLAELQLLRRADPRLFPQVSFTLTESNADDLPALLEWLLAEQLIDGPEAFSFRANDGGPYYGVPRPPRLRPALAEAVEAICRRYDFGRSQAFYQGIPPWLRGQVSPIMGANCYAGFASCWIDAFGRVSPCIQMTDNILGSLRDTDLDLAPIWGGRAGDEARERIAAGGCPDCWTDCQAEENLLIAQVGFEGEVGAA